MMKRVLLLTGKPGAGKSGIIKEVLTKTNVRAGGFYTEEIRIGGVRQGFRIVTIDGKEAILAHVNISSPYQVSKYKVNIDGLDGVAVSALREALNGSDLIVIDEIGKMELLSLQFEEVVSEALGSDKKILGAIMLNTHPFADKIKSHRQVKTLLVTRDNRNEVLQDILDWLTASVES